MITKIAYSSYVPCSERPYSQFKELNIFRCKHFDLLVGNDNVLQWRNTNITECKPFLEHYSGITPRSIWENEK